MTTKRYKRPDVAHVKVVRRWKRTGDTNLMFMPEAIDNLEMNAQPNVGRLQAELLLMAGAAVETKHAIFRVAAFV